MMAHSTLRDGRCVVLCVDDEPNALILRKLVLQRAGYEVITASSGKQALEVAESRPIDLLLSDQLMPGMHSTLLARISTQLKGRVKAITSAVPTDNPV